MTEPMRSSRLPHALHARHLAGTLAALTVSLALAGCPDGAGGAKPKACQKAYDQCTLRDGVLGVCDTVTCAPGQPEPCLVCRSQH